LPGICLAAAQQNNANNNQVLNYDLVVVGSDPEGIAAAVSGARNGLKTLLLDTRPEPGGLMTRGWLNTIDMNYGPNQEILNGGIFLEFYRQVGSDSFDVGKAQQVFNKMLEQESNLAMLMNVTSFEPVLGEKNNSLFIRALKVVSATGDAIQIASPVFIDATQDADLTAACGVPFSFGHEDIGLPGDLMAATLVFKLSGVTEQNWQSIYNDLNFRDKDPHSASNWWSAWGYYDVTKNYKPRYTNIGLRGLNIGRQKDGSVLINALHIFNVDPLDPESRAKARIAANLELPGLVNYLKANILGFKNAQLAGVAPELYIRESRHIHTEYTLTINDVLENKDFKDRIAFGSYPVDIQATKPGTTGVTLGNPKKYAIPFRSLVPLKVDNLLVVGRSAGFDCLAHGSARTIPVGMATGEAAGAAAALAVELKYTFRQMVDKPELILQLQQQLTEQGMHIEPFELVNKLKQHPDYKALKFMRSLGLAPGYYGNNYSLDDAMPLEMFTTKLPAAIKQTGAGEGLKPTGYSIGKDNANFNIIDASYLMCLYLGKNVDKYEAFNYLYGQGFFDDRVLSRIPTGNVTVGFGYSLIQNYIEWVEDNKATT